MGIIGLVTFPGGFFLNKSLNNKGDAEIVGVTGNVESSPSGEVAGTTLNEIVQSSPSSSNPKQSSSPTASSNPSSSYTSPSTNVTNKTIIVYASPSPQSNAQYTYPTPITYSTPQTSGLSKEYCDGARQRYADIYIDQANRVMSQYESEKQAWLTELAKRGYASDSQTAIDYVNSLDAKYSPQLDAIEAEFNAQVNSLKADGCTF